MSPAPESPLVTTTRGAVARVVGAQDAVQAKGMADHLLAQKPEDVYSDEACQAIVDAAKVCKLAKEQIEKERDTITGPLKQAEKAARELANPHIDLFKRAIDHAKELYRGWQAKKELAENQRKAEAARLEAAAAQQREQEAQELIEAGADPEDVELPPEASTFTPPESTQVKGGLGSMHQTKLKKYRVTNLLAAIQAHEELFKIELRQNDTKAALAKLRQRDPDAQLTGIEEYEDKSESLV